MKFKFFSIFAALIAFFAFSSLAAVAQDAAPENSPTERRFKRGGHGGRGMRGFERLNLSEAQRQQLRTLAENYQNNTAAQQQELRQIREQQRGGAALTDAQNARAQQLRDQISAARKQQQADFLAILTPEQRTEMENFRAQMKDRRGGFGGRRGSGLGKGFGGGMRGLGNLELSGTQQQQFRLIMEANRAATEAQRQEIRQILSQKGSANTLTAQQEARVKELSAQLRAAREKMQNDFAAILTPEQRQQIEQRREEKRKRMEERRQM